jgi:uncharacterized membrane protein
LEILLFVFIAYGMLSVLAGQQVGWLASANHPFLALGVGFFLMGVEHFVNWRGYDLIMQDWIPAKPTIIRISATLRVIGGIGLMIPSWHTGSAHLALVLYLVVLPVNCRVAFAGDRIEGFEMPAWRRWSRLALHMGWLASAFWCCRIGG